MAGVNLGSKAVGSTVKLNVDGFAGEFIVIHQGLPSSLYDSSCDGTWLLMKDIYEKRQWHSSNVNDYANSEIHSYLNSTFLNLFDEDIKSAIKQLKIPYRAGYGYEKTVTSGANGLPAKVFLLSSTEVNLVCSYEPANEGACLSYFSGTVQNSVDTKRVAKVNGSATRWWLRSPYCSTIGGNELAVRVDYDGQQGNDYCFYSYGVRPALILPTDLTVGEDGAVITNTPPEITCDAIDLGTKSADFSVVYSVTDADGDPLSITESINGKTVHTKATPGENTFEVTGQTFMALLNGPHTMQITASDGKEDVGHSISFTKEVTSASVTLAKPMDADAKITLCVLYVTGEIPEDAAYKVEVTNNAKDSSPKWEDCTQAVWNGLNHVFENDAAENGFAFNFRVSVSRGESGAGGYITSIQGGFQ